MDHNQDRLTAFRENQTRNKILSKEVQHLQEEKSKQVSALTNPGLAASSLPLVVYLFSRPLRQGYPGPRWPPGSTSRMLTSP